MVTLILQVSPWTNVFVCWSSVVDDFEARSGYGHANSPLSGTTPEELDIWKLLGVVRRRFVLIGTVALSIIAISMIVVFGIPPRYSSEAQILIENSESTFTRPQGVTAAVLAADQAAVLSEVQVLLSRDLAAKVSELAGLAENDEFSGQGRKRPLYIRLLSMAGFGGEKVLPSDERVLKTYYKRLVVQQIETARVIRIGFSAEDASLSALVANTLADTYIGATRQAKYSSDKDAARWLKSEIEDLRIKVDEAEQAVERFRTGKGLLQSGRDLSLNQQQLGEINTQLIASQAQASEARARASLVTRLIKKSDGLDAAVEVLNSRLIQRLRELQAAQSRIIAELSSALLPGHPRMRQVRAEQADIERRIRTEIKKIARGLENEADIAEARVVEIRKSLNGFKTEASNAKTAEVKLRALERESKAQRDLLESFLRRYREASARGDLASQPASARIISRATVASTPTYPAKGPLLALTSIAAILLALVAAFLVEFLSPVSAAMALRPAGGAVSHGAQGRDLPFAGNGSDNEDDAVVKLAEKAPPHLDASHLVAIASETPALAVAAEPQSMRRMTQNIVRIVSGRNFRKLAVLELDNSQAGSQVGAEIARALAVANQSAVLVQAKSAAETAPAEGQGTQLGLADLLSGDAGLNEVLSTRALTGLAMISKGRGLLPSPLPQARMQQIVKALEARFDTVIIMGGAIDADGVQFAAGCDLTLLIAVPETVEKPGFKESIEALCGAGVAEAIVVTAGIDSVGLYEAISAKSNIPHVA